MKIFAIALSLTLAQVAVAETEPLFEVARCQGADVTGTLSIYARFTDIEKNLSPTTGTLQFSNGPFGRMLYEQAPLEIKNDGSLAIKFELRGELNVLVADTKSMAGILKGVDTPDGVGLKLKCMTPSEATF